MRKRPLGCVSLLLILLLFLGTVMGKIHKPEEKEWEEREYTLTGRVYDKEWVTGEEEKKILYLEILQADKAMKAMEEGSLEGKKALCYLKQGQELPEIGSNVRITGKLKNFRKASNPGQFDARSYYHISGISFQVNQVIILQKSEQYHKEKEKLFQIRKMLSGVFDRYLSEKEASVMKTMVLGEKRALDGDIRKTYQRNGIAHLLAISGLHISLIGMSLYRMLRKLALPVPVCAGFSMLLMYGYGCMTGFSVSSKRALIMFALQMTAVICGRTYDLLTAVSLAAFLVLFDQPLYFYSSSFLFSFGCVLAIGLLIPAMSCEKKEGAFCLAVQQSAGGHKNKIRNGLKKWLLPGGTITISMLPLQQMFFYQLPLYSTFLNLLVIPLMSLLLSCGLLLMLAGSLRAVLSNVVSSNVVSSNVVSSNAVLSNAVLSNAVFLTADFPITLFSAIITGILEIYEKVCQAAEALPAHNIVTGKPKTILVILYLCVLLFLVCYQKKISCTAKWMVLLAAGIFLIFSVKLENGISSQLKVTFLDVGQGDCIVVETPYGQNYVVDCGSTSESDVGEYRLIPFLKYQGISRIDGVIMTHEDEDHISGMKELLSVGGEEGITVKALLLPDIAEEVRGKAYKELVDLATEHHISTEYISAGEVMEDRDFRMVCIHPERNSVTTEANEYSAVFLLKYQTRTMLLTGDIEGEGEQAMLKELQKKLEEDSTGGNFSGGNFSGEDSSERSLLEENDQEEKLQRQIDVLKVAHHGSRNSTGEKVLSMIRPKTAVISCGKNNSYGHPHTETLERLSEAGARWFCTKDNGAITVTVDRRGNLAMEGYLEDYR